MRILSNQAQSSIDTITVTNILKYCLLFVTCLCQRLMMFIHIRRCLFCVSTVVVTSLSMHFLRPLVVEESAQKCVVYNVPHVLRAKCQPRERTVCNKLDEMTTFSPCFPSTLLNSNVACHDSIACQDPSVKKTKTRPSSDLSRQVFFSALYTDNNFLEGALLLGHTLKKYHPHHQMYMMHLETALSTRTLCSLRQVGWIPRAVQNIPPPLQGTGPRFINQFTKLILWNMTDFDAIVYLDVDTLVLGDISHLHQLVANPSRTRFEFAAVADSWYGKFTYHFNAGVLVLHPSTAVFNELLGTMRVPGNYHPTMAEQAFLNAFFQLRYLQLPVIYNVNVAMYSTYPDLWERLGRDFKIVHFTLAKLFLNQSNSAYEVPLQLYKEVANDYTNSSVARRIPIKCIWSQRIKMI